MYQPYPSSGQSAEPLRPPAPAPVRTAVKFMYAGAAVSTVPLIITLPSIGDIKSYHLRWNDHSLTAAQLSHWRPLIIAVAIVGGLVVPALWLWIARANGRGRTGRASWPRCCSAWRRWICPPSSGANPVEVGVTVPVLIFVLTWLVGLVAVWLLWRPASSAFFKAAGLPAG